MAERTSKINIGGEEYELFLSTRAMKEILQRYGSFDKLSDKLDGESVAEQLDEVVWLITLLAGQSVKIHNLKNKDNQRHILTVDEVEVLTTPFELSEYKEAITEAMLRGTARNVESEDDAKNT